MSRIARGEAAKHLLDTSIHGARALAAERDRGAAAAYDRILHGVRSRTALLARSAGSDALAVNRGLLAMALHHADWLAPFESWAPPSCGSRQQLASLAQHLFARYPMPEFMAAAWLDGMPGTRTPEQGWYKQLGLGQSIRRVEVPMRITRGMAHRLLSAPCHLGVVGALRWAQVLELGGREELVHALLETRLGRVLEHEDFWEGVVHFLVNHPGVPLEQVAPIVDFFQHEKLEWRDGVTAEGTFGRLPPPQPDLAIKGRSSASVLRLVRDWHRELGRRRAAHVAWARSPFRDFRWIEKRHVPREVRVSDGPHTEDRVWTISELCDSRALLEEGRAMRHCVATYVRSCVSRRASIWSLTAETRSGKARVLTIDVDLPSRRVVQARRKCNALPGPLEKDIVRRWAERERITVPPTLRDLALTG